MLEKKNSCTVMAKRAGEAISSFAANSSSHLCLCKVWSSLTAGRAFACVGLKPEEQTLHVKNVPGMTRGKEKKIYGEMALFFHVHGASH